MFSRTYTTVFSSISTRNKGLIALMVLSLTACTGEQNYVPKPLSYPKMELPAKQYTTFSPQSCPFTFRIPNYANAKPIEADQGDKCWYNVEFPGLNATLHFSYKDVKSFRNMYELTEDARNFAYKHAPKANDIVDSLYFIKKGTAGVFFNIDGNAASSVQFYVTDSSKHYLRASLYFNSRPKADSLQPAIQFLKADIDTMLQSFSWR